MYKPITHEEQNRKTAFIFFVILIPCLVINFICLLDALFYKSIFILTLDILLLMRVIYNLYPYRKYVKNLFID